MAATTLTAVPVSTYAGDSLDMLISLADYPADEGWVLSYGFRCNGGTAINFSSTASAANHLLSIAASETNTWVAGLYKGVARVSDGTNTYTIWKGSLEVLPNPIDQPDSTDTRSHAKKCLDAINTVLEGKATREVLNTTIAGQSIGRMTWSEMLAAKSYYQDLVDAETAAENAQNGLGNSRNIHIRFGNA